MPFALTHFSAMAAPRSPEYRNTACIDVYHGSNRYSPVENRSRENPSSFSARWMRSKSGSPQSILACVCVSAKATQSRDGWHIGRANASADPKHLFGRVSQGNFLVSGAASIFCAYECEQSAAITTQMAIAALL